MLTLGTPHRDRAAETRSSALPALPPPASTESHPLFPKPLLTPAPPWAPTSLGPLPGSSRLLTPLPPVNGRDTGPSLWSMGQTRPVPAPRTEPQAPWIGFPLQLHAHPLLRCPCACHLPLPPLGHLTFPVSLPGLLWASAEAFSRKPSLIASSFAARAGQGSSSEPREGGALCPAPSLTTTWPDREPQPPCGSLAACAVT